MRFTDRERYNGRYDSHTQVEYLYYGNQRYGLLSHYRLVLDVFINTLAALHVVTPRFAVTGMMRVSDIMWCHYHAIHHKLFEFLQVNGLNHMNHRYDCDCLPWWQLTQFFSN